MTSTVRAHDFGPLHPERTICVPSDCTRDVVEIRRPAATRLEFVVGFIERRVAASAGIDTLGGRVLVIFAGERSFGAFFTEHAELFYKTSVAGTEKERGTRSEAVGWAYLCSRQPAIPGQTCCRRMSFWMKRV